MTHPLFEEVERMSKVAKRKKDFDNKKLKSFKRQVKTLLRKEDEVYDLKNKILDEILGNQEGQFFKIGSWECEESPLNLCVYSNFDRLADFCLYCGEPNERK